MRDVRGDRRFADRGGVRGAVGGEEFAVALQVAAIGGERVGGEPALDGEPYVVLREQLVERSRRRGRGRHGDTSRPGSAPSRNRRASSNPMIDFASRSVPSSSARKPTAAARVVRRTRN